MTCQDEVNAMFTGQTFEDITSKILSATDPETVIERPAKAIEVITKKYDFSELESEKIYENLIRDNDLTKWGTANAITATAGSVASADRSMDLESIGYKVVNMPTSHWTELAKAA